MQRRSDAESAPEPELTVSVVRSGGFAGLKRTWQAQPTSQDEAQQWFVILNDLPWSRSGGQAPDARTPLAPTGADRFTYRITVVVNTRVEHEVMLPENAVTGPWKVLVDRVQDAAQ